MTTREDPKDSLPPAFDAVARAYDGAFGGWPATRLFRFRLIDRIVRDVKPGARILDVGSGTGEDAVWLASLGFRVRGFDPSPGMVEVARAKADGTGSQAEFQGDGLTSFTSVEPFDAVYSNFGAMNCVPLDAWLEPLARLARPGGRVFLVLMGKRPLPEFLRAGPKVWKRRLDPQAPVGAGRSIWVSYPDPKEIEDALRPMFKVEGTETFGFLVPPPGMAQWPRRHPIAFGLLAAVEMAVTRWHRLCRFSDHFLIVLTRR